MSTIDERIAPPAAIPIVTVAWARLKDAVTELQTVQADDGSVPDPADHARADVLVTEITAALHEASVGLPHDADYLTALVADFGRWVDGGFAVPDFLDSLTAFQPQLRRAHGLRHLVLFPMYTQNGTPARRFEAVLVEVIWPEFVAGLEAGD